MAVEASVAFLQAEPVFRFSGYATWIRVFSAVGHQFTVNVFGIGIIIGQFKLVKLRTV